MCAVEAGEARQETLYGRSGLDRPRRLVVKNVNCCSVTPLSHGVWQSGSVPPADVVPHAPAVLDQVQRLLASRDFDASSRGRALLHFLVGETLANRQKSLSLATIARRVFESERFEAHEKPGDVLELRLRSKPVSGMFLRGLDAERLLLRQPDERVVLLEPMLRIAADVHINAQGRAGHAD